MHYTKWNNNVPGHIMTGKCIFNELLENLYCERGLKEAKMNTAY